MPQRLTSELLENYAADLRSLGVPIADCLAPGLASERMDLMTHPLGLDLPTEARVWWGWHDGVAGSDAVPTDVTITGSGWRYLSLEQALNATTETRDVADRFGPRDDPSGGWPSEWIVVLRAMHGAVAAIDCAVESSGSPVYVVEWEEGFPTGPSSPSMGSMVAGWIDAVARGIHGYERGRGWRYDWDRTTVEERRRGLV